MPGFERMFREIGDHRLRFENFRENGLLLPCREGAALRLAMPLHRGPHRRYSELVALRVGQIEADWSAERGADSLGAALKARMRLALLQAALRRFLLDPQRRRPPLSRYDPQHQVFAELDQVVEALWAATPSSSASSEVSGPVVEIQAMPVRARRRALAS